uniref:Uncharacterized protein n=1 Tax=Candidatus Kentrum eta TaxID=2126337 RepID=A0A450V839_9GAMM|nr:MAG: hypothetical protein BECKH772A_GA0070896_102074 [Candidatus Kentron sp. H]VFK00957.1 MAG: hypothetical protein BECKH772B_GA0070898_102124 [Candidatus Kentron sp. H]VFK04801.1 MAG: hypothetical protein BECKH772C_GA0070978_102084 [Candidatus Kentron sp. H]
MPRLIFAEEGARKHCRIILEQADREEPLQRRAGVPNPVNCNLLNRLGTYRDGVLAFALKVGSFSRITKLNGTYAHPRLNSKSAGVFVPSGMLVSTFISRWLP